jgi:hypothetical protein
MFFSFRMDSTALPFSFSAYSLPLNFYYYLRWHSAFRKPVLHFIMTASKGGLPVDNCRWLESRYPTNGASRRLLPTCLTPLLLTANGLHFRCHNLVFSSNYDEQ